MKRKIIDNGKVVAEQVIPNKMHLEVQLKTKSQVFKNKKAYTRKNKYKKDLTSY